jgi:hypothetical protein
VLCAVVEWEHKGTATVASTAADMLGDGPIAFVEDGTAVP